MALKNVWHPLAPHSTCLFGTEPPPYKCVLAHVGLGNPILGRPQQKNMLCFWGIWIWLKMSTNDWPKVRIANSDNFNPKKHEILDFVAKGKSKSSIKWDGKKNCCKHRGWESILKAWATLVVPNWTGRTALFSTERGFSFNAKRLNGCTRFGFLKGCRVTRCMLKQIRFIHKMIIYPIIYRICSHTYNWLLSRNMFTHTSWIIIYHNMGQILPVLETND